MIEGIIFDFDGVITDSESLYLNSVKAYLAKKDIEEEVNNLTLLLGQNMNDIATILKNRYCLKDEIQTIIDESLAVYDDMISYKDFVPMKGVVDFINRAKEKGIKMAIASSSNLNYLLTLTKQFGIQEYFEYIITGDDFSRSKPDPEIYNVTAQKLGIDKSKLIIIEDSKAGLTAGNLAEIYTIGFKGSIVTQDTSLAKKEVYSFEEIEL